jgi:hypothetical protein
MQVWQHYLQATCGHPAQSIVCCQPRSATRQSHASCGQSDALSAVYKPPAARLPCCLGCVHHLTCCRQATVRSGEQARLLGCAEQHCYGFLYACMCWPCCLLCLQACYNSVISNSNPPSYCTQACLCTTPAGQALGTITDRLCGRFANSQVGL